MFWQFESASVSNIDTLLEQEDVTLDALMEEDDIIQECKSQNQKLLQFLVKPEVMKQLIDLIMKEPSEVEDEKKKFKKANIACELLTCDVAVVNDALSEIPNLTKLSSFIDTDEPLNPLLASFFSKTMCLVTSKKSEAMLQLLQENEVFTSNLIKHLDTSAVMDLLLKLSSGVDNTQQRGPILAVLRERNIIKSVVDLFKKGSMNDSSSNSATYLCDLIKACREFQSLLQEKACSDPLLEQIESTEIVTQLLDNMLEEKSEAALVSGICVLQSLLEYKRHCANLQVPIPAVTAATDSSSDFEGVPKCLTEQPVFSKVEVSTEPVSSLDSDRLAKCVRQVHAAIIHRLGDFHDLLLNPPAKEPIETTTGTIIVPLGIVRLEVVHLIRALVSSNNPEINAKLAQLKTLPLLIDLFFSYPWNNFLHTQVEHVIRGVFGSTRRSSPVTSPNPEETGHEIASQLVNDLFVDGKLIERILEAFEDESRSTRFGYIGHLIKIANLIVDSGTEDPIKKFFSEVAPEVSERWNSFVENELSRINKVNTTPLVAEAPSNNYEDGQRQESALHQMQQMARNLCAQTVFDTSEFSELDLQFIPAQSSVDQLSKINFDIELQNSSNTRNSSSNSDSSSDESPEEPVEKPPLSFPAEFDKNMDVDGESTEIVVHDVVHDKTASSGEEDIWADFDSFAAERITHAPEDEMDQNDPFAATVQKSVEGEESKTQEIKPENEIIPVSGESNSSSTSVDK